jgi:hypothetical protein
MGQIATFPARGPQSAVLHGLRTRQRNDHFSGQARFHAHSPEGCAGNDAEGALTPNSNRFAQNCRAIRTSPEASSTTQITSSALADIQARRQPEYRTPPGVPGRPFATDRRPGRRPASKAPKGLEDRLNSDHGGTMPTPRPNDVKWPSPRQSAAYFT